MLVVRMVSPQLRPSRGAEQRLRLAPKGPGKSLQHTGAPCPRPLQVRCAIELSQDLIQAALPQSRFQSLSSHRNLSLSLSNLFSGLNTTV